MQSKPTPVWSLSVSDVTWQHLSLWVGRNSTHTRIKSFSDPSLNSYGKRYWGFRFFIHRTSAMDGEPTSPFLPATDSVCRSITESPKTNINQTIILRSEINSNHFDLIWRLAKPQNPEKALVISFNVQSFCLNIWLCVGERWDGRWAQS